MLWHWETSLDRCTCLEDKANEYQTNRALNQNGFINFEIEILLGPHFFQNKAKHIGTCLAIERRFSPPHVFLSRRRSNDTISVIDWDFGWCEAHDRCFRGRVPIQEFWQVNRTKRYSSYDINFSYFAFMYSPTSLPTSQATCFRKESCHLRKRRRRRS